ncbi:MAG: DUF3737 family protein [Clostridia bacterium]|nr:DUF3737 family protein [Clostridia bacterium]
MRQQIIHQTYDEERALYNLTHADVIGCTFAGPADGESAFKEARDITVRDCRFSLRYPFWHTERFTLAESTLDELTRAPIWYAREGEILDTNITGVKCLRECDDITLRGCQITSPEFGWRCRGVNIIDTAVTGEYFLFETKGGEIDRLHLRGKYSFQYTENLQVKHSILDTKDAFWHSKNVTVEDSEVRGEYLGWYAENLTLIRCHISGTQPLCYCKNLRLIDCTMEGTDLSFEYSSVEADVRGEILSVKNPKSGYVVADRIGEIIWEDSIMASTCDVRVR